ncbi:MAG: hypothetical protein GXP25_13565 [Planctomycetes bacterium]|nr:hypothetical protein [Planctomycetota bacterium]
MRRDWLLSWLLAAVLLMTTKSLPGQDKATCTIAAQTARLHQRGNLTNHGTFSFWTNGMLGDWFIAPQDGPLTIALMAGGKTIDGVPPTAAVEIRTVDDDWKEVARLPITSRKLQPHSVKIPVRKGFFGLRFRHVNRVVNEEKKLLRHLLVKEIRVEGASRANCGLAEYAFFGSEQKTETRPSPTGKTQTIATKHLRVQIDPATARWSVEDRGTGCRLDGIHPVFHIKDLSVDLETYQVEYSTQELSDHTLGNFIKVNLRYKKEDALEIAYTLLISNPGRDIIARVDFTNQTGHKLTVHRVAPVVTRHVMLGGESSQWTAIGDGKANNEPYQTVTVSDTDGFESWWYLAMKNRKTKRTVLLGNLTNHKGLGRFLLLPGDRSTCRVAAYDDYEGIVMPAGAQIVGEPMLVNFSRKGTDGLEHFGDLIAKAHDIDLMKQHPINPYVPEYLSLFNSWNGYGSGVVRGFPYKHDKTQYAKAFMDKQWVRANRKKLVDLGLREYGYCVESKGKIKGTPSPLVRRYGMPDFWFKAAQKIHDRHPEYYVDGRIDFSNPAVVEFERKRAQLAFRDPTKIVRYCWDFTSRWKKLPGQHDPFMTSAETYRSAMGIWRDFSRKHPAGAYAFVWMNIVGINYDRVDVIHIGADSDQGYYGKICTFTQGLTRQISGRYFLNGRVWWNSPDSFHVYVGGIYSYNRGKVHASFCAISGNLVHLAEPFTDEDIPADRLEIIKRVAPTTPDVSTAVDVFEHNPARLWNMPIKRKFGEWNVVGLFNVDYGQEGKPITQEIRFDDLDLSPEKEYLVYEFWGKQFLGVKKDSFTRTLQAPDCEIYSIVEKKDHPVLVSTSRHVRQMAYDILDLKWDAATRSLRGTSKVVGKDPYQLRIFVPEGYTFSGAQAQDIEAESSKDGPLLTIDFTSPESRDVNWAVTFR